MLYLGDLAHATPHFGFWNILLDFQLHSLIESLPIVVFCYDSYAIAPNRDLNNFFVKFLLYTVEQSGYLNLQSVSNQPF
jgi:hypothetical protein